MRRSRSFLVVIASWVMAIVSMTTFDIARAQTYPNRPITLIVPSSAGGPADVSARLIADKLSAVLGQQVVIETVPGAGGTIGMGRVARAAPDGYTLLIHQNGFAITPAIYAKLNFDTKKDFVTVALANHSSTIFVGRKDLPPNTFQELVAYMKGPGKPIRYAHPGKGTNGHLQTLVLLRATGTEATMVPYRGIAPAVNDMLGGHVDFTSVAAAVAAPHVRSGALKAYATTAAKRIKGFPDLPTAGEAGYKELERPFWHAIFAPVATPRPILDRLNAAIRETVADPKVLELYEKAGVEPFDSEKMTIEAGNAFVQDEINMFLRIAAENNIAPE